MILHFLILPFFLHFTYTYSGRPKVFNLMQPEYTFEWRRNKKVARPNVKGPAVLLVLIFIEELRVKF